MHDVIGDLLFSTNDSDIDEGKSECVVRLTEDFPRENNCNRVQRQANKTMSCLLQVGKRAESRFHCTKCPSKPAPCIDDCFAAYHTKIKYWK